MRSKFETLFNFKQKLEQELRRFRDERVREAVLQYMEDELQLPPGALALWRRGAVIPTEQCQEKMISWLTSFAR